ncbi:Chorion peroxidase [Nymphon striatum]|nr:Chorion peroxidase [Nymphon striatum]
MCHQPNIVPGPSISGFLKSLVLDIKHVDDIDLFVGGLLEKPISDGAVGETFACLMGKQFRIFMRSDRFFYTNGHNSTPELTGHNYSKAVVGEFNKASLAKLICDNTDILWIQREAMQKVSPSNPLVNCDSLPSLDLQVILSELGK